MGIDVINLTGKDVAILLGYEEGHILDLKSKDIAPAKLTNTISAFANADGGELFIGIEDSPRKCSGFASFEDANGHLQIFEHLFPLGDDYEYEFLRDVDTNSLILHVTVHKTRTISRPSDGIPRLRRGAQNLRVDTPEKIRQLELDKGIASFETETVNVDVDEITNSTPILEFMLAVVPQGEPINWLRKQQLIRQDKPTVAGIILFSDLPQAILPKRSGVKIYRYRTRDEQGTRETLDEDIISIEGNAYYLIAECVSTVQAVISDIKVLGPKGLENVSYPKETLHEVVTNAVLHRDYSIADDIHIRIFDNRVEVESPGKLAGHITVENILDERFARNGNLVRVINRFPNPPNKDIGEGLNTAFSAMRNMRLREPIIEQKQNSVVVQIRHELLASPEEIIMEYLDTHTTINNKTARELTGLRSENLVKKSFYRLRDKHLIEMVPGKTAFDAVWRKPNN